VEGHGEQRSIGGIFSVGALKGKGADFGSYKEKRKGAGVDDGRGPGARFGLNLQGTRSRLWGHNWYS